MYIYNIYVYICCGLRRVCDGDLPCAALHNEIAMESTKWSINSHRRRTASDKKHLTIAAERQMLGGI